MKEEKTHKIFTLNKMESDSFFIKNIPKPIN